MLSAMLRSRGTVTLMCLTLALTPTRVGRGETKHTVYVVRSGDTLGRIARRFDVSIDALCRANAIDRGTVLHPKRSLLVPASRRDAPATKSADVARDAAERRSTAHVSSVRRSGDSASTVGSASIVDSVPAAAVAERPAVPERKPQPPRSMARRGLGTSPRRAPVRPRSTLPPTFEQPPEIDLERPLPFEPELWSEYFRRPATAGHVTLLANGRSWRGHTRLADGTVPERTKRAFRHALFNHRNGRETDISERLIRLLVHVSDTFGGRPLEIASGYRDTSYEEGSRHPSGRACDFSIPGVPNDALFAFLQTLPFVGVGYYPNSTFVHLDVRPRKALWVDVSSQGERPRYVDPWLYFGFDN